MRWLLTLCCILFAAPSFGGNFWAGLTSFAAPDPVPAPLASRPVLDGIPDVGASGEWVCEEAILAAEVRYDLPKGLLLRIGLTEAGYQGRIWPWTVNAEGRSRYFTNKHDAVSFVAAQEALGVERIDTGCLQINRYWHPDAFADLSAAFDPERNADYAARYLRMLHAEFGNWRDATGTYHSRDPLRKRDYTTRVRAAEAQAKALVASIARGRAAPVVEPDFEEPMSLLPPLSADLSEVDIGAILAAVATTHRPEVPAPTPQRTPKPDQGHALFAAGGGALFPARVAPLY